MPVLHGMGMHGWHWRGRGTPYHQLQGVWVFPFAFQKTCFFTVAISWLFGPTKGMALDLRGWMDHLKFRSTFLMDGTLDPADSMEDVSGKSSRHQSSFELWVHSHSKVAWLFHNRAQGLNQAWVWGCFQWFFFLTSFVVGQFSYFKWVFTVSARLRLLLTFEPMQVSRCRLGMLSGWWSDVLPPLFDQAFVDSMYR